MEFKLTVNMDNAAFQPDATCALCKILEKAKENIKRADINRQINKKFKLLDSNGNTIGCYEIIEG